MGHGRLVVGISWIMIQFMWFGANTRSIHTEDMEICFVARNACWNFRNFDSVAFPSSNYTNLGHKVVKLESLCKLVKGP